MDSFETVNIAGYLAGIALETPHALAVVASNGCDDMGRASYVHLTTTQLQDESDYIANGLESTGITKGTKTVLMVKPSPMFFALVFALLKVGAVPVIIDPGLGLKSMGQALSEVRPEAFIGMPKAHLARILMRWCPKDIKILITAGKKYFWGGHTLSEIRNLGYQIGSYDIIITRRDDMAAILFTSGSTGVPKGVVYTHGIFDSQIKYLKEVYNIKPGEIDLSTFPLFALFGPALGMTSIIPDMDPTKPASANPEKLIATIEDFGATNMFVSPALVEKLGRYGEQENIMLSSIKRVISAGAPASPESLKRFGNMLQEDINIYTPYGATEALPVCNIGSHEVLTSAKELTEKGKGACVGLPVRGITLKVIKITDEVIEKWDDSLELPDGEIGEFAVKGNIVTKEYYNRKESTALAKIYDKDSFYHRMGDVGYKDGNGKFWFCGRKTHRVQTENGTLFTICCEAVFNNHPSVYRTALVGVKDGEFQRPVICVELENKKTPDKNLIDELREIAARYEHTKNIDTFLIHPSFPVDIRHNAKIFREKLAVWAEEKLK